MGGTNIYIILIREMFMEDTYRVSSSIAGTLEHAFDQAIENMRRAIKTRTSLDARLATHSSKTISELIGVTRGFEPETEEQESQEGFLSIDYSRYAQQMCLIGATTEELECNEEHNPNNPNYGGHGPGYGLEWDTARRIIEDCKKYGDNGLFVKMITGLASGEKFDLINRCLDYVREISPIPET